MMKKITVVVAACIVGSCLLTPGCGSNDPASLMLTPDSTKAFLLDGDGSAASKGTETTKSPIGYAYVNDGVTVKSALSAQIAGLLLRDDLPKDPKACKIRPGVSVRFTKGGTDYEVALCFECDIAQPFLNGKRQRTQINFDPVRLALLELVQKIYPELKDPRQSVDGEVQ